MNSSKNEWQQASKLFIAARVSDELNIKTSKHCCWKSLWNNGQLSSQHTIISIIVYGKRFRKRMEFCVSHSVCPYHCCLAPWLWRGMLMWDYKLATARFLDQASNSCLDPSLQVSENIYTSILQVVHSLKIIQIRMRMFICTQWMDIW